MKKIISALLVLVMAMSLFAGCGSTEPEVTVAPTEAPVVTEAPAAETEAPTEAAPQLSGTMKVVATSEAYVDLFNKFTEETGVAVELLSMSSGEVLSKLRAEGGTPSADLWFGGGVDAFMSAKEDGLLEQVNFEASAELDPTYKDADNYWFSKGLTIVGFLVNNTLAAELELDIPTSWADLLDEQYAGEIIMSNPAISGTNYGVVNCLLQVMGEEEGWKYFEALNENIAYYGRRGSDPKNKVTADEYAIGITYLDGTIDALLEQYDVTIVYPADGIPYIPEGVAVFKGAENVDAAKYFVEWLYSGDENLQMLSQIDQKTAVKVIKPTMEGVELAYSTDILVDVDVALFGSQREDILAKFEVLMGDKAATE
ncbi:MAG: ABC transporter substrate-binding protein [Oscillospiraceae bacterium]|nr:ABC transporter substrate-binding protein [Oscillospiraceae bacterium]